MLHLLNEFITNGYTLDFANFFVIICISFAILVITSKNPISSVLFLIGLFIGVSLYLIMLGLYFIGLSYLLVYVGAVSILFLFILMLINIRISELLTEERNSATLAVISIMVFNYAVVSISPYSVYAFYSTSSAVPSVNILDINIDVSSNTLLYNELVNTKLASVNSKSWDCFLWESSHISSIGNVLYTSLSINLILIGFILLLSMVGAILITVKRS